MELLKEIKTLLSKIGEEGGNCFIYFTLLTVSCRRAFRSQTMERERRYSATMTWLRHCIGFVATLVLVLEQWNFNAILLTDNLICEMKPFYHLASVNGPAGAVLLLLCPATTTSIVLVLLMTNMHHPRGFFNRLFWELHTNGDRGFLCATSRSSLVTFH